MGIGLDPLRPPTWIKEVEMIFELLDITELQKKKECELLQLKQGSNPLSEYVQKFQELSIFAPHVVDTNEHKARQFERGSSPHIQASIIILKLPTYKDVLERARMFTGCGTGSPPIEDRSHGKRPQAPSNARSTPFQKQQRSRDDQQASMVVCPKCGKSHRGQCLLGVNVCFRCGLHGIWLEIV
ncbi:uncharacterized protein LOC122067390 [Macadamia integrifolia]|uniref:uncharacterized protein LOC122067390 n=1 Tax=Macadamia integrifolia TaxID=60698 RepID=UPI001C4FFA5B|nr:uncharacterized protein LOC122067390 [Macadamia integrifolia]